MITKPLAETPVPTFDRNTAYFADLSSPTRMKPCSRFTFLHTINDIRSVTYLDIRDGKDQSALHAINNTSITATCTNMYNHNSFP